MLYIVAPSERVQGLAGHMEKQETKFGHGNRKWKPETETGNGFGNALRMRN